MAPTSVFLIGATGYIGGFVLALLLQAPKGTYTISALVRSKQKTPLLEKIGVRPVLGSLSDLEALEREAASHDVTIHTADADDLPAAKALLRGLRRSSEKKIYIHTSGTGVLADDAKGESCYVTVYDDADTAQVNSLPETQVHRDVDLAIKEASEDINAHIVLPSTIWGLASHPLVESGLSNFRSIQVPALVRASIHRGQAGVVGSGVNHWPNVHVEEVAQIYILILEAALAGKLVSGKSGSYFFGESGEHVVGDISKKIGETLAAKGIGKPEPTAFTPQDIAKYFGGSYYLGSTSRAKASRARQLGWNPTKSTPDFLNSISAEVELLLKEDPKSWNFGGKL